MLFRILKHIKERPELIGKFVNEIRKNGLFSAILKVRDYINNLIRMENVRVDSYEEDTVIFLDGEEVYIKCPLCGTFDKKQLILKAKNPFPYSDYLNLYKCNNCKCMFYHPFQEPDYSSEAWVDVYWKFYVEQGAGIDSMIKPILMLKDIQKYESFLDVGCGFGYTLDFVKSILGFKKVVGVEPGEYGKLGKDILEVQIFNDYLQNIGELKNEKFDIIFSSEVIEHIQEPHEFIGLLNDYINEDGVLILTTPNAEFVSKDTKYSTLLGILSPGYHVILYSPTSIAYLLKRHGFSDIRVVEEAHRLIIFATKKGKLELTSLERRELINRYYIPYLKHLTQKKNDVVIRGSAWRLFKEYVNMGLYEDAIDVYNNFLKTADLESPKHILDKINSCKDLECIGKTVPFYISGLYYYLGMCYLNYFADYNKSSEYFSASFDIGLKLLSIATAYYEEVADLLWRAKFHEGLSYLYLGDKNKAIEVFNFILEQNIPKREFFYIKPPFDLIKRIEELLNE